MKFFGVPLQNGREFTEIERNPKGVRTYTFQSECKSMHLIVATRMVAHTQKKINKQKAPWEARPPDPEVSSLTL
jgi:hypothetical protein